MKVSLICTVLNECASLPELLGSMERQTRSPDEVVIADGGSTDGTLALLKGYKGPLSLKVLELPGSNIAQGRNAAIRAAAGDVIASTDAGVQLDPDWLMRLVGPFEEGTGVQAVAGFFASEPRSPFEIALGATVLPEVSEVNPATFLPSSRSVAYTKVLWERVSGYPEWLDYCEDLVFDLRLQEVSVVFYWAPRAIARFRPRSSLRAFFMQYFRYARGDGKADLWRKRHVIRYAAYAYAVAAVVSGARFPFLWLLLMLGGGAYLYQPYRRLFNYLGPLSPGEFIVQTALPEPAEGTVASPFDGLKERRLETHSHTLSPGERAIAIAWVPFIRLVGDVAKMLGYPVGVWWRWRHGKADSVAVNPSQ